MSRNLLSTVVAVIVLGSAAAVGSTLVFSNLARSQNAASGYVQTSKTKADFDRTFADVVISPARSYTDADRDLLREAGLKLLAGSEGAVQ